MADFEQKMFETFLRNDDMVEVYRRYIYHLGALWKITNSFYGPDQHVSSYNKIQIWIF